MYKYGNGNYLYPNDTRAKIIAMNRIGHENLRKVEPTKQALFLCLKIKNLKNLQKSVDKMPTSFPIQVRNESRLYFGKLNRPLANTFQLKEAVDIHDM